MSEIDTAALRAAHDEGWCLCSSSATDWDAVRALLDELDQLRAMRRELAHAYDPGELDCGRIGLPCTAIHQADRWCRACRIRNALALGSTDNLQQAQIDAQERS